MSLYTTALYRHVFSQAVLPLGPCYSPPSLPTRARSHSRWTSGASPGTAGLPSWSHSPLLCSFQLGSFSSRTASCLTHPPALRSSFLFFLDLPSPSSRSRRGVAPWRLLLFAVSQARRFRLAQARILIYSCCSSPSPFSPPALGEKGLCAQEECECYS